MARRWPQSLGSQIELIGLGTGAGTKTKILLEELDRPAVYVPIDISKEQLENSSERFRKMFPNLQVLPVAADYLEPFELPLPRHLSSRSVVYFPGSTIGNFKPDDASEFLSRLVDLVGEGGGLLIGVDLQKDRHVIEAAYNDGAGVTAKFNQEPARPDQSRARMPISIWPTGSIMPSTIQPKDASRFI